MTMAASITILPNGPLSDAEVAAVEKAIFKTLDTKQMFFGFLLSKIEQRLAPG